MLGRLLRAAGLAGKERPGAAAGFFAAADLPADLPAHLREALRAACGKAAAGEGEAALAALRRNARDGAHALPWALLGVLQSGMGRTTEADAAYSAARHADAGQVLALHFLNRGREHLNGNAVAQAERCLRLAVELAPGAAQPLEMLGFAGYLSGDIEAACAWYERALAVANDAERGALSVNRLINTLPQIAADAQSLARERAAFEAELARLAGAPARIDDPLGMINRTAFFLSYQGHDDRQAMTALANLFLRSCPALGYRAARIHDLLPVAGRLPRVAFVSMNLGRQSVGVWYRTLVRRLIEAGRLEAALFTYGTDVDSELKEAAERHGMHAYLAPTLEGARAQIEASRPDMLIYTDVAMHPFMYFLAMSRLAPVQTLLVGHPDTSGIPTIDHFVSNVHQDGANAQAHYSENLVRLPLIPVHVEKAALPSQVLSRAQLGLGETTRYYLCPMMLQKMHPDFDRALADILHADPAGEVVLFADSSRARWQGQLEARFDSSLGALAERVVFRPFAQKQEFLSLILAADCLLDAYHFSGGVTTYTALSLGCAPVTLPGATFRSRMSAGILAQLGITDTVAGSHRQYVELALRLAANPRQRLALRERIEAAHSRIFATEEATTVMLDWIEATLAAA